MTVWVEIEGVSHRVELPASAGEGGTLDCVLDGAAVIADVDSIEPGVLSLIVAGVQYRCTLDGEAILIGGRSYPFTIEDRRSLRGRRSGADGASGPRSVKAPMPGRVVRVLVAEGDEVEEQQGVVVIEAMKMQNELKSPKKGRIIRIAASVESTVSAGEVLIVVE
jgi:biotin carboxyl carrier protein